MTDFEWVISPNRFMLKVVGLWPPDNQDSHLIVWSKCRQICNVVILLFILLIPAFMSLTRVWGDMVLIIENLQHSLPILMALSKVCIIQYKQEVLASLIDMVKRDWIKIKMKNERDVMLRRARISRAVAMCGLFIVFVGLIIMFSSPCFKITMRYLTNLNESEKSLPIQTYYLHDVSKSPQFELTLLMQAFAVFVCGFSYSGIDNLLGLLVLHICGQLENLHSVLLYIEKYPNFNTILKYNVQDHIRLIRSIEIVDDTFHLMLLGIVLCFAIIFGLQGFLLVNVLNQKGQFSVTQVGLIALETLFLLLHMFLYCLVGEILVTQVEKIHHATYENAWYTIEPRAAQNLIIIMQRANNPLYITAGKIFPMTMATFCNLLKTSASYISVLLAHQI